MAKLSPFFVLSDTDHKRRVLGYRVCFNPDDQPTTNVEVEGGYFACAGSGWEVALCAANALRDELNANAATRLRAVAFCVSVLRHAEDWQDAQDALSNHDEFGPWLTAGEGDVAEAQAIIREAEERLGDALPY